jgi:lipopolysaccharide biosynthesis protein
MEIQLSKDKVIKLCEIGISQTLLNAGFKASTYVRYRFLVSHTMLYRLRSYLIRGCKRINEYVLVLLFRIFRQHRKDRKRRRLGVFIKRVIISVVNIVSKIGNVLRDPREKLRSLILYFEINIKTVNVTHFLWKQLVLYYKMPFIKVDLLRDNPMAVNIDDYAKVLSMVSNYSVPMIMSHLSRVRNGSRET